MKKSVNFWFVLWVAMAIPWAMVMVSNVRRGKIIEQSFDNFDSLAVQYQKLDSMFWQCNENCRIAQEGWKECADFLHAINKGDSR